MANIHITPRRSRNMDCAVLKQQLPVAGAFTILEMLIVISIISILTAILVPVFHTVRANGRRAVCISNMKQIGTALRMYTDDCDGTLPQSADNNPGDKNGANAYQSWQDTFQPYMKNTAIAGCPDFPEPTNVKRDTSEFTKATWQAYALNAAYCVDNDVRGTLPLASARTDIDISYPSDLIIAMEKGRNPENYTLSNFTPNQKYWADSLRNAKGEVDLGKDNSNLSILPINDRDVPGDVYTTPQGPRTVRYRHNNTGVALFADGHVKAMVKGSIHWAKQINGVDYGKTPVVSSPAYVDYANRLGIAPQPY